MKLINASFEILDYPSTNKLIELAGRTCYKSEDKITEDSANKFVQMIINRKHGSVLEHEKITVRFINDRGISHEEVRHRIATFSQESTRYVNYSKTSKGGEIVYIDIREIMKEYNGKTLTRPNGKELYITPEIIDYWITLWLRACKQAEQVYMAMTNLGCPPQLARSVLNNSTKTEIVITANLREWREILRQRTDKAAHPQMREVMIPLWEDLQTKIPIVFDNLNEKL